METVLRAKPSRNTVLTVIPIAVALNLIGTLVAGSLKLPIYLDMVGTAVSAILLGPWWGVLTAVLTNGTNTIINGPVTFVFVLVNITGALVWGFGVHRFGLGKTIPRFFLLNVIAAVACSIVAAPIVYFVFGGGAGAGADLITVSLLAAGQQIFLAVFSANILSSLADKILGGFISLAIVRALPVRFRMAVPDLVELKSLKTIGLLTLGCLVGLSFIILFLVLNG